jgi:methyltransferase-like protein 6
MDPEWIDHVRDWVQKHDLRNKQTYSNEELAVTAPAAVAFASLSTYDDVDNDKEKVLPLCIADPWDAERKAVALEAIKKQGPNISEFWKSKYKKQAGGYWTSFYKRNTDNFYKDRHYLHIEFPELLMNSNLPVINGNDSDNNDKNNNVQLLEVGCGVGNAVIPLLDINSNLYVNAIDFATSAINILNKHEYINKYPGRLIANVCNVIDDIIPISTLLHKNGIDIVLCMFVISAISPEHQLKVFNKLSSTLKKGGKLLFRDYGRYDEAQLRFKNGSKVADNLYVRNDGTLAYYFDLNELIEMCSKVGLYPVSNERCGYIRIAQANRQQGKARHRVFVQCVFEKR